jgi:DNA-binding transcriptional regulator PaaX
MTPHPVISTLRDLVYGKEEAEYVQAFESTHMFGDMDVMVEKVWGKNVIERTYRELFKEWHGVLSKELTKEEKMREILYSYIKILRTDPGLPPSLVGKKWISFEAFNIFREIRGILLAI